MDCNFGLIIILVWSVSPERTALGRAASDQFLVLASAVQALRFDRTHSAGQTQKRLPIGLAVVWHPFGQPYKLSGSQLTAL